MNPENRLQEIKEELQSVLTGRGNWLDAVLPPVIFILVNAFAGVNLAVGGALLVSAIFAVYRLARRQPVRYALGGVGAVLVAAGVAYLTGRAEGYFLPGIVTGILTVILCLVSVIIKRPLVAFTSYIARRWPLEWYWHLKVRPAYSEVTLAWGVFFGLRTFLQFELFQNQAVSSLGIFQILSGWPATILLLIFSYFYGLWRLSNLKGPSVEEFKLGKEPPWEGQKRGF
ncbi:MAG: DUF3159 domain-containing protein [Anaerolineales bacterium]|jgi:hypothetical protein